MKEKFTFVDEYSFILSNLQHRFVGFASKVGSDTEKYKLREHNENSSMEKSKSNINEAKKIILHESRRKVQDYIYQEQNLKFVWNYLKSKTKQFDIEDRKVKDFEKEELGLIRECYPELGEFKDSIILDLYDSYQYWCNQVSGYDVYREEEFSFYLLCELAEITVQDPRHLFVGEYISYYLIHGKSLEESRQLAFERAITIFDSDLEIHKQRLSISQISLKEIMNYYHYIDHF